MTGSAGSGNPSSEADERLSQHPVDVLIRDFIRTRRPASDEEIARIIKRMATAPFSEEIERVPLRFRGLTYQGHTLGVRTDSLTLHLVKRVIDERQWASGTTSVRYVADLRRAVRHPLSRLAIYERRGGHIATILATTVAVVAEARRGSQTLPNLLVAYSADRGIIVSGYQVTGLVTTGIPQEALWLR